MRSRVLASAIMPAMALPALAFGHGGHAPGLPGFGIERAVRLVSSAVSSLTPAHQPPAWHSHVTTRPAAGPRYVVIDCTGNAIVRPGTFVLACADGNDSLTGLRWNAWNPGYAAGTGTQRLNNCTPNCAQGKFRDYPVRVIFWGDAKVPGHQAQHRYTMITLLYTGRQPSVGTGSSRMAGPPSVTGDLWN